MVIIFNIENQTINCIKNYCPAADSREYLKAKFIFTPDWDGCVKTAIFSGTEKAYEVLLTGDECTVPHEVLGGRFGVSVFGINGDMRITTDTAYITVHKSGFAEGETPSDPTPTVYEQLLNEIEENKQAAEADTAKLQAAVETEAETREETDTTLREAIVAESEARAAADAALEQNKADKTSLLTKADKEYNSGFIGGSEARLNGVGGAAIGYKAQASLGGAAGNTSKADEGGAVGYGANTNHGGAVGKDAQSMHGGAVGRNAVTRLGAAIGDGAQTVDAEGNAITAIQLGTGTNTEEGTAKFFDYTMMNADGTIPRERIPMSINRYDVSALPSKSQTYDFSDGVSKFIAVERMDVAVESETQVMMSAANAGNKYGLAQFDFGSITDGATRIIAEYDTKYDGGRWEISLVDMSKRPGTSDKSSYDTAGVAFRTGTRDANNNFYLNGDNKYDTTLNNVWVHIRADIDLTAGTLKYEVSTEGTLKYSGEITVPESVGTIDGLEIYTWAQGTIYADNIKINALYDVDGNGLYVTDDGQYIYKDGEPVRVGFDDLSGYYTKSETDTKIASATSDTVKYSDYPVHRFSVGNLMDKIDVLVPMIRLYEDYGFAPKLIVQNKTSAPSGEVIPYGDTIQRYGEVSAMTIMMEGPYGAGDMYCGMVQFTSPAVPAEINVSGVPMFGVDCADGVFTPQANKRYTLKFVWDGVGYFGEVIGYSI